jgi:hypothetical protein
MPSFKLIKQANLNFCKLQKPMLDWVERKALSLHYYFFECEPFHSFSIGYTRNFPLLRLERTLDYPHIYIDSYNHLGMTDWQPVTSSLYCSTSSDSTENKSPSSTTTANTSIFLISIPRAEQQHMIKLADDPPNWPFS